jgi:hypothetical protein
VAYKVCVAECSPLEHSNCSELSRMLWHNLTVHNCLTTTMMTTKGLRTLTLVPSQHCLDYTASDVPTQNRHYSGHARHVTTLTRYNIGHPPVGAVEGRRTARPSDRRNPRRPYVRLQLRCGREECTAIDRTGLDLFWRTLVEPQLSHDRSSSSGALLLHRSALAPHKYISHVGTVITCDTQV